MAESGGERIADDRERTEKQIADLVPYVSGSAVDAVRDALLRIVVENQDHSEILDLLLPKLEQMPSKRSEALDWLDDDLARLNDDEVISYVDRIKRAGGHELRLERESGSEPSNDSPTVEPERPAARPRPRRRWMMPTAVAACLPLVLLLSVGWGNASLSYRTEHAAHSAFRADFDSVTAEVQKLQAVAEAISITQTRFKNADVTDNRDEWLARMDGWFDVLLERIEAVALQCESVVD